MTARRRSHTRTKQSSNSCCESSINDLSKSSGTIGMRSGALMWITMAIWSSRSSYRASSFAAFKCRTRITERCITRSTTTARARLTFKSFVWSTLTGPTTSTGWFKWPKTIKGAWGNCTKTKRTRTTMTNGCKAASSLGELSQKRVKTVIIWIGSIRWTVATRGISTFSTISSGDQNHTPSMKKETSSRPSPKTWTNSSTMWLLFTFCRPKWGNYRNDYRMIASYRRRLRSI